MTMERVDRPTESVPPRWIKRRYRRHCRNEIPRLAAGDEFKSPLR